MKLHIALGLLLGCVAGAPHSARSLLQGDGLRALSWNVHGFGPVTSDADGEAALRAARGQGSMVALFAEMLSGEELDVIALQEVASEARLNELAAALGMHAAYFPGGWRGEGWEEGISGAILSRFPIIEVVDRPGLAPYGDEEESFSRFLGRALLDVHGERVAVYAAHMLPSWENTTHIRLAEIEALTRAANGDLDEGASVLVLGDMNHEPGTDEHAAWLAAGFDDAFAQVGEGEGLSCPSLLPEQRIDYAFVAGPLRRRLEESRVLDAGAFGADAGFALSDHLPLYCGFGPAGWPAPSELPERAELPDPLVMLDGTRVESVQHWRARRRPELIELFTHYVYGDAPPPTEVRARVLQSGTRLLEGRCTLEEVELSFPELGPEAPTILLALFLPSDAEGPLPIFLGLNKCGNHTLLDSAAITQRAWPWQESSCAGEDFLGRGARSSSWVVDDLCARGYGLATFCVSDIDPDRHEAGEGIQGHVGSGQYGWATIAAWAWGLSRAIDHLVGVPAIDAQRIALIGHSRRGKTALLAAALDPRVALVVPHQSGTGGMALSRDNDQETVERITRVFPHWFHPRFAEFSEAEARLPVDQHLLMALIAPRPLLDTAGLQDTWANYESALRGLRAASPVWELFGARGLFGEGVLSEGEDFTAELAGDLLQVRLDTGHVLDAEYWKRILDFADLQYERRGLGR